MHVEAAAGAAPLVAAALFRGFRRGPRAWVLAWVALLVVENVVSYWYGLHGINNLWIGYAVRPVAGALMLWALSLWQAGALAQRIFRMAIPAMVVVFVVLAMAFDRASAFSRAAQPSVDLVCLAGAAFTLVVRSREAAGGLLRQDWFWICAGLVLYFGTTSSMPQLGGLLVGTDPVLLNKAYEVEAVFQTVAYLMMCGGVACPAAT